VRDEDRGPTSLQAAGQDRDEGQSDDDRGQDERHRYEGADGRAAGKLVAAEHVCRWKRDDDRERRRRRRLPDREPEDVAGQRVGEDVERRAAALGGEPALDDRGDREAEEKGEEYERHAVGGRTPGARG
jgi:hypothetical protein